MSIIHYGMRTLFSAPGQTRNQFIANNVSAMGKNPRLRFLVARTVRDGKYLDVMLSRIAAFKANKINPHKSLTSEERLALAAQKAYFAELLAKIPPMPLP
jgi:hypothetical protein